MILEVWGNRVRAYAKGTKPPPWVDGPADEGWGRGVPLGVPRVIPSRRTFRSWAEDVDRRLGHELTSS